MYHLEAINKWAKYTNNKGWISRILVILYLIIRIIIIKISKIALAIMLYFNLFKILLCSTDKSSIFLPKVFNLSRAFEVSECWYV